MTTVADRVDDSERLSGAEPWALTWPRAIALALVAAFVGGIIGWRVSDSGAEAVNDADVGFLADMTVHHQGAVNLSFTYLANQNDNVVTFVAQGIITKQATEISIMNGLLSEHLEEDRVRAAVEDDVAMDWMGVPVEPAEMPGMATPADYEALEVANGVAADDLFTRLMIDHHAAGIAMARSVIAVGESDGVRELARSMVTAQRDEIIELNVRREALGLEVWTPPDFHVEHASH